MIPRRPRHARLGAFLALLVLAVPAAALRAADTTLVSVPAARVAVDLGLPGPGVGDLSVSDHDVLDGEAVVGSSLAANVVAGPPDSGGRPAGVTSRIGFLSMELPDGALLALGTSFGTDAGVVPDGGRTIVDAPQVRAIVGGTGDRAGARGELVTTNRGDDRYARVIRPAATGPAGEILLTGTLADDTHPSTAPAAGEMRIVRVDLTRDGAPAGERLCVRIAAAGPGGVPDHALALTVYRLPDGEVAAIGRLPALDEADATAEVRRLAIVGGTGAYAGARGEVAITQLGGGRTENLLRFLDGAPAAGPLTGGPLAWAEALAAEDATAGVLLRVAAPPAGDGRPGVAVAWTGFRGVGSDGMSAHHLFLAVLPTAGGELVLGGTAIPGIGGGPTPASLAVLGGTGDLAGTYGTLLLDDAAAAALDGELLGPG